MPEKAASTEQNHAVGTSRLDPHLRGIGDRPGYAPRLRGLCGESEPPRKRITFGCSWLGDRAVAGGAGLGVWSSILGLSSYGGRHSLSLRRCLLLHGHEVRRCVPLIG